MTPEPTKDTLFPVVGIGASAGGLEAFTQLLSELPNDTGMAFVLVQHLDPKQKSLLSEILARTTRMPVSEVQEGMVVEPNHVYTIPPNTSMTISQTGSQAGSQASSQANSPRTLHLQPRDLGRRAGKTVDVFSIPWLKSAAIARSRWCFREGMMTARRGWSRSKRQAALPLPSPRSRRR